MSATPNTRRTALLDLDDAELEHHLMKTGGLYPSVSTTGKPLFDANGSMPMSDEERQEMIARLEQKFSEIFDVLRIDRNDPNSTDSPFRLARMWVTELFAGRYSPAPKITVFPNRQNVDELVISKGIKIMSVCSHHWQPISGTCAIGYVPREKVIGLSKFTRIVEWFSRRGQIQEELGEQIADFLIEILDPIALGVVISSRHYCMIARGVEAHDSSTMVTSVMRGELATNKVLRAEFLGLIGQQ
ncbi:MAG: GTP cyclohydrolase I [Candidatus Kapaibacterium sp.]